MLTLKLELLQVTGSFKARGAMNRLLVDAGPELARGIVTASGGNHGLAVARTAHVAGRAGDDLPAVDGAPAKVEKLKAWGRGRRDRRAMPGTTRTRRRSSSPDATGAVYFHPFADPAVVAGQGTLGLEILEEMPERRHRPRRDRRRRADRGRGDGDQGARRRACGSSASSRPGSPMLMRAVEAGANVALERVTTSVATMACAKTDERIFEIVRDKVDEIVLVDDDEMREAARWLWFEMGLAADLSGAAAIAALRRGRYAPRAGERLCAIVCGAGPDAIV